ncbi:Thioredoxin-like fold protein [Metarhizium album ARSEF 1941]|uniref:Thioredoxin-like fold protein n=1 Tax=Metarhizium album (strain ARSEF 1941) TaxID=1081103 RepID=A0A0B2X2D5_METAS|nr:Thioredoxin-like fold protein [Metarhizium album ARSEF 1941]KHN99400.1 Thioredoxin-like fold protein [Metarhizium album ARSEF 1941]
MYESQVSFALDTICPWTYLAKKRLEEALARVRATSPPVSFALRFEPFQLFPDFPDTSDKQAWYLHEKHSDNEAAQQAYQSHMTSLLEPHGVKLNFAGEMGNTLHAHRVIQQIQQEKGTDAASRLVQGLYRRYFEEAKHPSRDDTLVEACVEAGVGEAEARELVQDKETGLADVSARLRQVAMDVDAVPVVVVEGKRRDITLTGAKDVKDYVKALETVIKESG